MAIHSHLYLAFSIGMSTAFFATGFTGLCKSFRRGHPFHPTAMLSSSASVTEALTLPDFQTKEDYLTYLESVSGLPLGFATGTAEGRFVPIEAPSIGDLPLRATVIHLTDGPTNSWAAVFTKNKFPGAPVLIGRERLASGTPLQALVINNKISNVCSGGDGVADSERVCESVALALNLSGGGKHVLPSSTGIIGWRLPVEELANDIVPRAIENMQGDSALKAASAIMTTDRYPKVRSRTLPSGAKIVGIAKGAGMIEPNMATMLGYIMTDAVIEKSKLQNMLSEIVSYTFNSISIDGDESTSDTVAIVASNKIQIDSEDDFRGALEDVCRGLAADIVRNGEGTGHVMRVRIDNFPGSNDEAVRLGRHIVNSPLFKCAISGNDPNTGRLAGAVGSFMGKFMDGKSVQDVVMKLGGRTIFANKKFVLEGDEVEKELSDHIRNAQFDENEEFPSHQKYVEINVDFGAGDGSATVLGSDLTDEYIAVNADYRS